MAITNITEEVEALRAGAALGNKINLLRPEQMAFMLKALLAAGHVSRYTMEKAVDLAETISID